MFPLGQSIRGTFFTETAQINDYPREWEGRLRQQANLVMNGQLTWFSYHAFEVGEVPNWFRNPFSGAVIRDPDRHWTELSDFDLNIGDIKNIWEPSRFDWVTDLARAYRVFGDERYLRKLNDWLNDWSEKNPLNSGPNWKCGQETSIRIMKLLNASCILDKLDKPADVLQEMVFQHLRRVAGNIRYAVAQDNNHGITEAAALMIGSAWLLRVHDESSERTSQLRKWRAMGEEILNDRIIHLIGEQGTFSQRSITYHRVVVDTASFVIYFGRKLNCYSPKVNVKRKLDALVSWQLKFIIPGGNGDCPNMGANDGAMFENLHGCDYRDFRPSAQLANWLCHGFRVFERGPWDEVLFWRDMSSWSSLPVERVIPLNAELLDRQFLILRNGGTHVFLRIPDDRFRPFASDAFHLDVWHNERNVVQGSGTFSYNSKEHFADYFKSIRAHNTVQFRDIEQMPRISKFLLGKWIKASFVSEVSHSQETLRWKGEYVDAHGNVHSRELTLTFEGTLEIRDQIDATGPWTVRYHLGMEKPETMENGSWVTSDSIFKVRGTDAKVVLEEGYSSLYYQQYRRTSTLRIDLSSEKEIALTIQPKAHR